MSDLHLVRCNEPIGDTGQNFTPENFPQAHDYNCDLIEAAINGGAVGSTIDFFGNGRLVQNDFEAGAPQLTPSPSLTLIIPTGAKLRLDGTDYTLDEDVLLDGIPQNFTGYCVPSAEWDADSESYLWSAEWLEERPALGSGVLCKVTTDADHVLTIDSSEEEADIIPWLPVILARLRTVSAGGGGEGGSVYSGVNAWLPSPADSRQTSVVLLEKFANLQAQISALSGSNTRSFQTRNDEIMFRVALVEQGVIRVHRPEGHRYESAHVLLADDDEVYGSGVDDDENFVGDGLQPDTNGKFAP